MTFEEYCRDLLTKEMTALIVDTCLGQGWSPEKTRNDLIQFLHGVYSTGATVEHAHNLIMDVFLKPWSMDEVADCA